MWVMGEWSVGQWIVGVISFQKIYESRNKSENQDEDAQWERFDKCLSHLIPGARGARIQPKITSGKPRQTPWLKTVIGVFQGFRH